MSTLKHVLRHGGAVLALAVPCLAVPSLAAAQTSPEWRFVYQGFDVTTQDASGQKTTVFKPESKLWGSFFGVDGNADGAIGKDELTSLIVWGAYYLPCGEWSACTVNAFSYSPGGSLSFDLAQSSRDPEGYMYARHEIVSGLQAGSVRGGAFVDPEYYTYTWTAQTTLTLTGPVTTPVPEPSSWLMLGAGALLVGWRQRRRRS